MLLSKINGTWDESVLWGTVDEWDIVKDTGNGKDGGWRDFLVTSSDGLQKILSGVVDTRDEIGETLSVGSPEDNDLIESIGRLEVGDVLADLLDVLSACLAARDQVISTVLLVGSDEVRVVDGWQWSDSLHFLVDQSLQGGLKDASTIHGVSQVEGADIPSTDDNVIWVDHGQDLMERNVDILGSLRISAQLHGGAHGDGAVVVGSARTLASSPGQVTLVGKDTSSDSGAIVASESDQHHTDLWDVALDLEVVDSLLWSSNILASIILGDQGSTVGVLGLDLGLRVDDVWAVDREEVLVGGNTVPVCSTGSDICVWCHIVQLVLKSTEIMWSDCCSCLVV